MAEKKNILMVLFADKDIVKGLGAKWDASKKQWYFMGVLPDELKKYISYVVDVPFDDKDIFKKRHTLGVFRQTYASKVFD